MSENIPENFPDPGQEPESGNSESRNSDSPNLPERVAAQEALLLLGSRRYKVAHELFQLLDASGPENPADPEKVQSLVQEDAEIGREALDLILQLIDSIGYPTSELVGEGAAAYAWDFLSRDHNIPDEAIQRINYALQLQPECPIPDRNKRALFQDRTMIQISNQQLFGSIWMTLSIGTRKLLVPYSIVDVESVDQRRDDRGLPSLLNLALSQLVPTTDGEVLLPAAYAFSTVPKNGAAQDGTNTFNAQHEEENLSWVQGTGAWFGVPAELLQRRARVADLMESAQRLNEEIRASNGSDDSVWDRISELKSQLRALSRDNFEYLLKLCRNPALGFPTDHTVGNLAAKAAFSMLLTHAMRSGDSLEEVLNAALFSTTTDSVKYPGTAEIASLTDMCQFYRSGMQTYGTTWLPTDQSALVITPVQTVDILNVDSRRASMQLGPWYEYAVHLGKNLQASPHLPIEYFTTLIPEPPEAENT
jgi:hypothetical protein